MEMTAIVGILLVFSTLSSRAIRHRRAGTSNRGRKVRNRIDYSTGGCALQALGKGFPIGFKEKKWPKPLCVALKAIVARGRPPKVSKGRRLASGESAETSVPWPRRLRLRTPPAGANPLPSTKQIVLSENSISFPRTCFCCEGLSPSPHPPESHRRQSCRCSPTG